MSKLIYGALMNRHIGEISMNSASPITVSDCVWEAGI